jgi:hypothetical protein
MARTSSRVRDLAHSGGNGVHAGHGCQWLLLTALRQVHLAPAAATSFSTSLHRATHDEAFANTFSTWGSWIFNNASRSRLPSGATTMGQMSRHYQMRRIRRQAPIQAVVLTVVDSMPAKAGAASGGCVCPLIFPFRSKWSDPARSRRRRASGCRRSRDSALPDALTVTMRYPLEVALRAKARGGIAEIAHGI